MKMYYAAFTQLINEVVADLEALLPTGFTLFLLCVLVLGIVHSIVEDRKAKRLREQRKCVEASSVWLRRVKELNARVRYYEDILNNGHSAYYVRVNSKAKFDKTDAYSGLCEFVEDNRDEIERTLDRICRNRIIDEMYQRSLQRLRVEPTQQQCEEIGVTIEEFRAWEQDMVDVCRLRIPKEYLITCYVTYTSPQGRNHYSKEKTIGEAGIQEIFKKLDSRTTFCASESWRRKTERAKVTPAVRFRIFQRDGGKCRMCGRSAQDGVELEVDHIVPIARGGDSRDSNLQTLCRECNRGKGSAEYAPK